jgi:hypothetical protein
MPDEQPPSWKLARERARDKLLKDPFTQQPYRWWGFSAPTSTFARLGQDTHNYMTLLEDSIKLGLIGTLIAIVPMVLSSSGRWGVELELSIFGRTSVGASNRVEWGHVLCDMALTMLFFYFIHRQQIRVSVTDKAGEINNRLASKTRTRSQKLWPTIRLPSYKRSSKVDVEYEQNAEMVSPSGAEDHHAKAALVVQKSFRGQAARKRVSTRGSRASRGSPGGGSSPGTPRDDPAVRERRTAGLPAHVRKSADQSGTGDGNGARRKSSTGGALIPQLKVQGTRRTMANAGEACSVVVWGWPAGEPMPPEVVACIEVVTKNPPWAILQPRACAEANHLFNRISSLAARREGLEARAAKAQAAEGGTGGAAGERARKLAEQIAACKQEASTLSERASRLSHTAPLLPLAFVTFESVMMARRVINAARSGVLFTAPPRAPPPSAVAPSAEPGASSAASSSVLSRLRVNPAPNALDVRWEHLEVPVERRKRRIFKGYGLMFIVMPIACVMLMVSTYFAVILKATPPFINCPPRDDGLPCELTVPIVLTNIGNWLWTTVMLISAYQLIIQPVLWLSTDGGPCGAGFAEATTSYTESCLHLMLRVCAFQILGTILTACFFIPIASSEHYFMGAPAGWIPPEERLAAALNASAAALNASAAALNASTAVLNGAAGSALTTLTGAFSLRIYDMGGAVITNSIIGDSTVINLVIDGLVKPDYLVPLLTARYLPTQAAMRSSWFRVPFTAQKDFFVSVSSYTVVS